MALKRKHSPVSLCVRPWETPWAPAGAALKSMCEDGQGICAPQRRWVPWLLLWAVLLNSNRFPGQWAPKPDLGRQPMLSFFFMSRKLILKIRQSFYILIDGQTQLTSFLMFLFFLFLFIFIMHIFIYIFKFLPNFYFLESLSHSPAGSCFPYLLIST